MLDLEAIWKGWQLVVTWFLVLTAAAVASVLADMPQHGFVLALIGVGAVLVGIGRTLLHLLEVIWLKRPDQ